MLVIVALGGCLEFYDFAVFVLFAGVLGELFFPPGHLSWMPALQAWGLFAAGYIFRPFGGIVLAHFGDMFGRKRVFAFSILLMAFSTFGIALLPTYSVAGIGASIALLALRAAQGMAIGGEVPGAWVFAAEHMTPSRRGLACGAICSGLGIGVLLASLMATAILSILSADEVRQYGWRIPFLIGGAFGLVNLRLRRMLLETPSFVSSQANKALVVELPLRSVIQTQKRALVLSILATWILSASVVVLALLMPRMLYEIYGYSHERALVGSNISTMFLSLGLLLSGWVLDRIGIAAFLLSFGAFLAISALAFFGIGSGDGLSFYLLCCLIGLAGSISTGAPYLMVTAFPVAVRYTGVSFAYNISYAVFGGLTPVFIAALALLTEDAHVYYLWGISAVAVGLGISLLIRPFGDGGD